MILGIGIDMVDIRRIEALMERFGEQFENRTFTPEEQAHAKRKPDAANATYAKRFAAKEACLKALGTGHKDGVYLNEVEVINNENGTPQLRLTGGALKRLEQITPANMKASIFISLTDEYPYAQAHVIISCTAS